MGQRLVKAEGMLEMHSRLEFVHSVLSMGDAAVIQSVVYVSH